MKKIRRIKVENRLIFETDDNGYSFSMECGHLNCFADGKIGRPLKILGNGRLDYYPKKKKDIGL